MNPLNLENRITVTIENIKDFLRDKSPEEMSKEEREPVFNDIMKAGEYYRELTKHKGKNYRKDLIKDINTLSNKFLNYES